MYVREIDRGEREGEGEGDRKRESEILIEKRWIEEDRERRDS